MASSNRQEKIDLSVLPKNTARAFEYFSNQAWLKDSPTNWYLAGGTSLALQFGHRESLDLDFFTQSETFSLNDLLSSLKNKDWSIDIAQEKTVYGTQCDAKVSFIAYPFFTPACPCIPHGSINLLDADDIAVMKIIAISQRGKKRDFVDLYEYVQRRSALYEVLMKVPEQFSGVTHDYSHLLKALVYFADADVDGLPKLKKPIKWEVVKKFFMAEVKRIGKKLL